MPGSCAILQGVIAEDTGGKFSAVPTGNGYRQQMMDALKNWFKGRFSQAESPTPPRARNTSNYRQHLAAAKKPADPPPQAPDVEVKSNVPGRIESQGPGKNVFVPNPYVREDLGTHDSLKILDPSLVEDDQEEGIDPYNTGVFERPSKWDQRFRE